MPKDVWITLSSLKDINEEQYIVKIDKKEAEPLRVTAIIRKKDSRKSEYRVILGIYKQWVFMSCGCPHFQKKILPNAFKYGTEIDLPKLKGIFVKEEDLPIDKHCKMLNSYLRLV